MKKKSLLVIINPISGTVSKNGLEQRLEKELTPAGFSVECVYTQYAGHGSELAAQAAKEGYYGVLVAGGDGTVNEVASALRSTPTIMGILPFGSGNGLARHIYGSIDIDRSIHIIARNFPQDCDFGSVNGQPFFCTFGLGFDAKVSQQFSHQPTRGLVTYVKSAIVEYLNFQPTQYTITSNGHEIKVKAFIVAVCNASQYGNNAYIAPQASIRDGKLDIVIIHQGNPLTRALAGVELFTGRLNRNTLIESMRFEEATIRHLPGPGHIDGDPVMTPETLNIKCHKGGLRLFYDPDKPPFMPFITPIKSISTDSSYMVRENTRNVIKTLKDKLGKIF